MKYAQLGLGRVFVLRLEDGDRLPETVESFAAEKGVKRAFVSAVGAVAGGKVVVGPETPDAPDGVRPMIHDVCGVHEGVMVGTIFPTVDGRPELHMHAALGRGGGATAGCVRTGLDVWKVLEVVIMELTGEGPVRRLDPATGFVLLEP